MEQMSIIADREILILTVFIASFIALLVNNAFMLISIRENEIKRLWLLVITNIAIGVSMGHSMMLQVLIADDFGYTANSVNFINFELVAFFVGVILSAFTFGFIIYLLIKAKIRVRNRYKYKMKF